MPWEAKILLPIFPKGICQKWYEWAYKPEGIKQVGCIYTAQGFELIPHKVSSSVPIYGMTQSNNVLITDIKEKSKDPMLKSEMRHILITTPATSTVF